MLSSLVWCFESKSLNLCAKLLSFCLFHLIFCSVTYGCPSFEFYPWFVQLLLLLSAFLWSVFACSVSNIPANTCFLRTTKDIAAFFSVNRNTAMTLILHCADISHPTKTWDLHKKWTDNLMEEFFCQVFKFFTEIIFLSCHLLSVNSPTVTARTTLLIRLLNFMNLNNLHFSSPLVLLRVIKKRH